MGGQSSLQRQAEAQQMDVSRSQLDLMKQYADFSQQRLARGDALQQPLINKDMALASGDPNTVLQAAGPQLGQIAKAGQAAKENIFNNIGPGAARDFALSQVPMQTYSQSAGYLNQLVNQAPQDLAALGTGQYSVGLTQAGQGQTSGQISNTAAGQVGQLEQQTKSSTLNFLGQLAGAGGKAFGLGGFGGFGGGGGGGGGSSYNGWAGG